MRKYLSIFILTLSLLAAPNILKPEAATQETRIMLSKKMDRYYREQGVNRGASYYRPFLYSASRVAGYFPMFPAETAQERMIEFLSYSGTESEFKLGLSHINVPGARYFNGTRKVKFYSVDFGHAGLSEQNVKWTYIAAKAIQDKKPIPTNIGNRRFRKMLKNAKIPKEINLMKIDLTPAIESRKEYKVYKTIGMDPETIRKTIQIPFDEKTQDDIDSILIYRVLVELERYSMGWNYDTWDKELYSYLYQYVE